MVYVSEGMQLQIPAGALVIPIDGTEPPPVQVVVRLDTWQHWLRVATSNNLESSKAHAALLESLKSGDESAKGKALQAEFQAAMVAMSAAAFALDAFYAAVKDRIPRMPDVEAAWARNRTRRTSRIAQTLRRAFTLGRSGKRLDQVLAEMFKYRDWAVHPPAQFQSPIRHPDLAVGVEWRFVAFSASNSLQVNRATLDIISRCLGAPNPQHAEVTEWVKFGATVIGPIIESFEADHGPITVPTVPEPDVSGGEPSPP